MTTDNNQNPSNTQPVSENQSADSSSQQIQPNSGSTGLGFLLGIAFCFLLGAYPLYKSLGPSAADFDNTEQLALEYLQMQITLTHKELESVERQLDMIAEAEAKYSQLVEQKFDLETSKTHLDERLEKLELKMSQVEKELDLESNRFDRISNEMRLD